MQLDSNEHVAIYRISHCVSYLALFVVYQESNSQSS